MMEAYTSCQSSQRSPGLRLEVYERKHPKGGFSQVLKIAAKIENLPRAGPGNGIVCAVYGGCKCCECHICRMRRWRVSRSGKVSVFGNMEIVAGHRLGRLSVGRLCLASNLGLYNEGCGSQQRILSWRMMCFYLYFRNITPVAVGYCFGRWSQKQKIWLACREKRIQNFFLSSFHLLQPPCHSCRLLLLETLTFLDFLDNHLSQSSHFPVLFFLNILVLHCCHNKSPQIQWV